MKKLSLVFSFLALGGYVYYRSVYTDYLRGSVQVVESEEVTKVALHLPTCNAPSDRVVEEHFKDNAGALPVDRDFDSPPGEICGNGESFYCTSRPPKKAIPASWTPPPRIGSDPNYKGPAPGYDFKESPYAMPASKAVLARAPIYDAKDKTLTKELRRALGKGKTKIGVIGKASLPDLSKDLLDRMIPLSLSSFKTKDEVSLKEELLSQGVEFVLIQRSLIEVAPWIEEEMSHLHIRLRDGLDNQWFHPLVLGSAYSLYKISPPSVLSRESKVNLTSRVRSILSGKKPSSLISKDKKVSLGKSADNNQVRAIVSLRSRQDYGLKGRKIIKRIGKGSDLESAIDDASLKIKNKWSGHIEKIQKNENVTSFSRKISEALSLMEIEIEVLYDLSFISDREPSNLVWNIELGLHGVFLQKGKKFEYLEPAYAIHMEVKSELQFVEAMLKKNKVKEFLRKPKKSNNAWREWVLHEQGWRNDTKQRFGRFRTSHWIEKTPGGEIAELYRGVPLKEQSEVSRASLENSLALGASWLIQHQTEDGQYAYKYTPTNKEGARWTAGGNIVRHALNPYTLLMVNKAMPKKEYVESAKKGIAFSLSFLRKEGDRCVICHRDTPARYYNAKINAVAVTILSILKLGEVADISEYKDVLSCLSEELLYVQNENGHFWQYDVPEHHPYYGADNTIAPGEIIFALSRLYSHFKDKKYKEAVDRALPWYVTSWRMLTKRRSKEGIYSEEDRVNIIGIIPWLVTAMNDLYISTGDKKYAELAFEQQDWIDNEFFLYPDRAKYPDYEGASFKLHWELPAINSCQYAEGAAAAYNLSKLTKHSDLERRREVVLLSMRFCLQLQFDAYESTFFLPAPREALGGYRYTLGHLRLRNDYSYHAMAAIAQSLEYLDESDYSHGK